MSTRFNILRVRSDASCTEFPADRIWRRVRYMVEGKTGEKCGIVRLKTGIDTARPNLPKILKYCARKASEGRPQTIELHVMPSSLKWKQCCSWSNSDSPETLLIQDAGILGGTCFESIEQGRTDFCLQIIEENGSLLFRMEIHAAKRNGLP